MDDVTETEHRILVVDDEQNIRDLVSTALKFSSYVVESAADGVTALNKVGDFGPDLIVLDVNMPGFDGFEVLRRLRQAGDHTPVIFLTARDGTEDKLEGFSGGGDDYITKPFGLEELVARVGAVLKRSQPAVADGADDRLGYADLEMDEAGHRVTRAGEVLDLSPTEFRLLRYLLLNPERVLSKAQILEKLIWCVRWADSRLPPGVRTLLGILLALPIFIHVDGPNLQLGAPPARAGLITSLSRSGAAISKPAATALRPGSISQPVQDNSGGVVTTISWGPH